LALLHWTGCTATFTEGHASTIDLDPVGHLVAEFGSVHPLGLLFNSSKKQKFENDLLSILSEMEQNKQEILGHYGGIAMRFFK